MAWLRRGGSRPYRSYVAAAGHGEHQARGQHAAQDGRQARPTVEYGHASNILETKILVETAWPKQAIRRQCPDPGPAVRRGQPGDLHTNYTPPPYRVQRR